MLQLKSLLALSLLFTVLKKLITALVATATKVMSDESQTTNAFEKLGALEKI